MPPGSYLWNIVMPEQSLRYTLSHGDTLVISFEQDGIFYTLLDENQRVIEKDEIQGDWDESKLALFE